MVKTNETLGKRLMGRKGDNTACTSDLTEEQNTEVAMLMGMRELDIGLLHQSFRRRTVRLSPRRTRHSAQNLVGSAY